MAPLQNKEASKGLGVIYVFCSFLCFEVDLGHVLVPYNKML